LHSRHRFLSLAGIGQGFAGAHEEAAATEIAVAEFLDVQSRR
jgi:hypothetical protein